MAGIRIPWVEDAKWGCESVVVPGVRFLELFVRVCSMGCRRDMLAVAGCRRREVEVGKRGLLGLEARQAFAQSRRALVDLVYRGNDMKNRLRKKALKCRFRSYRLFDVAISHGGSSSANSEEAIRQPESELPGLRAVLLVSSSNTAFEWLEVDLSSWFREIPGSRVRPRSC